MAHVLRRTGSPTVTALVKNLKPEPESRACFKFGPGPSRCCLAGLAWQSFKLLRPGAGELDSETHSVASLRPALNRDIRRDWAAGSRHGNHWH